MAVLGAAAALAMATAVGGAALPAASATVTANAAAPARYWRIVHGAGGSLSVEHFALSNYARVPAGAEPDSRVSALDDPDESVQWGLSAGDYPAVWPTTAGNGVIVAVVDSGVRATHQDLTGAVLPGTDYVQAGGDGTDDANGHGTHVAGIIAARMNGVGGVGGAPGVKILPVRVLDASGSGYMSDVASGIIYAADHGARVINLSLGGTAPSPALEQAMQYANGKGAVVVAAAGNGAESGNAPIYPAAYPEAVAVAAVDNTLHRADFSQYGSYVDLAAPGVNILSDWSSSDSAYAYASGTSMAAPFASAAAALVVAHDPTFSAAQVTQRLESTAVDLGSPGYDEYYGHGLVDAAAAVNGNVTGDGYWVVASNGHVVPKGGAQFYGDPAGFWYGSPVVASAPTASGRGYWLATSDGHVFAFGDAHFYGDMHTVRLNSPIVAMARTATGNGYWLLGSDGGVFSFGDAHFYGSTGNMRLNAPVLDMATTPSGHGYWFVAADGGVFSFGDASFHGSTGNMHLWAPVASMTASADGRGYWLVARDGGIFAFNVPFHGSLALDPQAGSTSLRIRAVDSGLGYYILGDDGSVHSFGTARFDGSAIGMGAPAVDLMTN
ncbi:MAG TPA: S8 family serine peptidase [Acidimicrobiia bacterium]